MADDNTFAAIPRGVQKGGDYTSEASRRLAEAVQRFVAATSYDPQDPPWGDDAIGKAFENVYIEPHSELVKGVEAGAVGFDGLGKYIVGAGTDFEKTQQGNVDTIRADGGRRV
ncbi:hypothetical protein ACFRFU_48860 [Streptomyces sp. NPDC056704]|uniref:hypothetical protein n=1 Tax=Streptomyces TaxID=1883 RepID=UPI00369FA7B7